MTPYMKYVKIILQSKKTHCFTRKYKKFRLSKINDYLVMLHIVNWLYSYLYYTFRNEHIYIYKRWKKLFVKIQVSIMVIQFILISTDKLFIGRKWWMILLKNKSWSKSILTLNVLQNSTFHFVTKKTFSI